MEEAWNYGASVSTYVPVFGKTLNINAEYYYTDFLKQVVVDMDSNPHEVAFYNLDGRSYSHVFQRPADGETVDQQIQRTADRFVPDSTRNMAV